jgi:hypothetical protein
MVGGPGFLGPAHRRYTARSRGRALPSTSPPSRLPPPTSRAMPWLVDPRASSAPLATNAGGSLPSTSPHYSHPLGRATVTPSFPAQFPSTRTGLVMAPVAFPCRGFKSSNHGMVWFLSPGKTGRSCPSRPRRQAAKCLHAKHSPAPRQLNHHNVSIIHHHRVSITAPYPPSTSPSLRVAPICRQNDTSAALPQKKPDQPYDKTCHGLWTRAC